MHTCVHEPFSIFTNTPYNVIGGGLDLRASQREDLGMMNLGIMMCSSTRPTQSTSVSNWTTALRYVYRARIGQVGGKGVARASADISQCAAYTLPIEA
jgi:hypothetical protein